VSPGRLHTNRDVLDERSVLHGLDTLSRTTLYTQVVRSPAGRQPVGTCAGTPRASGWVEAMTVNSVHLDGLKML